MKFQAIVVQMVPHVAEVSIEASSYEEARAKAHKILITHTLYELNFQPDPDFTEEYHIFDVVPEDSCGEREDSPISKG